MRLLKFDSSSENVYIIDLVNLGMDWFLQRLSGAGCGCGDIGIGPKCSIEFRGLFF